MNSNQYSYNQYSKQAGNFNMASNAPFQYSDNQYFNNQHSNQRGNFSMTTNAPFQYSDDQYTNQYGNFNMTTNAPFQYSDDQYPNNQYTNQYGNFNMASNAPLDPHSPNFIDMAPQQNQMLAIQQQQVSAQPAAQASANEHINIREKVTLLIPQPGTDDDFYRRCRQTTTLDDTYEILEKRCNKAKKMRDFDKKEMMRFDRLQAVENRLIGLRTDPKFTAEAPPGWLLGKAQWNFYTKNTFTFPEQQSYEDGIIREAGKLYRNLTAADKTDLKNLWAKLGKQGPVVQTPEFGLEMAYYVLLYGHVADNGLHRKRDDMNHFIKATFTHSIRRDLCAAFVEKCPKCAESFQARQKGWETRKVNATNGVAQAPNSAVKHPRDSEDSEASGPAPKKIKNNHSNHGTQQQMTNAMPVMNSATNGDANIDPELQDVDGVDNFPPQYQNHPQQTEQPPEANYTEQIEAANENSEFLMTLDNIRADITAQFFPELVSMNIPPTVGDSEASKVSTTASPEEAFADFDKDVSTLDNLQSTNPSTPVEDSDSSVPTVTAATTTNEPISDYSHLFDTPTSPAVSDEDLQSTNASTPVEDSDSSVLTATTDATTIDPESQSDSTELELTEEEFYRQAEEDDEPPTDPTPQRSCPSPVVPPTVKAPVTTKTITTAIKQETDAETLRKQSHEAWMAEHFPNIKT